MNFQTAPGCDPLEISCFQSELHVLPNRQVRENRVILEHHADVALGRIQIVDHLLSKVKRTAFNGIEACDHPQQRRFAAAGRAEEGEKLSLMDIQIQIRNDDIVTVFFSACWM